MGVCSKAAMKKVDVSGVPSLMISELPIYHRLVTWQIPNIEVGAIRGPVGRQGCPCRKFQRRGRIAASATASRALVLWRRNTLFIGNPGCDSRAIDFSICANAARTFACIFIGRDVGQLGKGDFGWRPDGSGADRLGKSHTGASRGMSLVNTMRNLGGALAARFKQNAALFTAIWWGRSEATRHWGQAPFLDISFDEHEAHLAEINMDTAGAVGPNGRK